MKQRRWKRGWQYDGLPWQSQVLYALVGSVLFAAGALIAGPGRIVLVAAALICFALVGL